MKKNPGKRRFAVGKEWVKEMKELIPVEKNKRSVNIFNVPPYYHIYILLGVKLNIYS